MKKVVMLALFLLSMFGFSNNGVWEIVSTNKNSKVRVVFVGDSNELMKTDDLDNPSGIFVDYLESSVTQGDGSDLDIIKSTYKTADLKPGNAKVTSISNTAKSWEVLAVLSKSDDDTLMGLFGVDAYKDIKIYDKGNKTIINYKDIYFIFNKGDISFENATAWG